MKKLVFLIVFSFALFPLLSQLNPQSYEVISAPSGFDFNQFDLFDQQMTDLYRSQSVDNEIVIEIKNQIVIIRLFSADKLTNLGVPYEAGAVKKGAIFNNNPGTVMVRYRWQIGSENEINGSKY
ncbi:MAG: hypothetical protein ACO1O6_12310 [Bacteroidota bacterium]